MNGIGVVPSGLQLDQRQLVRVVAVDLVGGHGDEDRVRGVTARALEEVQRAAGVDVEVVERAGGRQIVAGLRCSMNHDFVGTLTEQVVYAVAVADVDVVVRVALAGGFEALTIPGGVAAGSEEVSTHVVVHAVHVEAQTVEELDGLRADQPSATRDQDPHDRRRAWGGTGGMARDTTGCHARLRECP